MEPTLTVVGHEAIDHDELLVHDWRVAQLKRLGIPGPLAERAAASHLDWHQIARLAQRGGTSARVPSTPRTAGWRSPAAQPPMT